MDGRQQRVEYTMFLTSQAPDGRRGEGADALH